MLPACNLPLFLHGTQFQETREASLFCSEMSDSNQTSSPLPNSKAKELQKSTLVCTNFGNVCYLMGEAIFWLEELRKNKRKSEVWAERKKISSQMGIEPLIRYVTISKRKKEKCTP